MHLQVEVSLASNCWVLHFPACPGLRQPRWRSVETVSPGYELVISNAVASNKQTMPLRDTRSSLGEAGAQSRSLLKVWFS